MPRVKRGVTARARHKKVLAQAKGFRGRRNAVYRIAKEAVMKAGQYAYRDRRLKKRDFRALWIQRINAGAREHGMSVEANIADVEFLGDKFTFVEDCKIPKSCTILIKGPNRHTIDQIKDAVRDGLRAVKNCIEDEAVVPGAGAFEIACAHYLKTEVMKATAGRAKLGVEAFAEAMLVIPKTLAENSGFDVQESIIKLTDEYVKTGLAIGLDCNSGDTMLPAEEGVWDNFRVKRQCLYLSTVLATQLLLVDEVMKAGKQMGKQKADNTGLEEDLAD